MADINPGDVVRISAAFTDAEGVATDPTTVTLRIRPEFAPEETFLYGTDVELEKDSVGAYHLDYTAPAISPAAGLVVKYEWTAGGAVQAVETGEFLVVDPYGD